jgi:DNA-binding response OmpR family regulator
LNGFHLSFDEPFRARDSSALVSSESLPLLREVWGYRTEVFSRTVDIHVGSLRQKIESDPKKPQLILTV